MRRLEATSELWEQDATRGEVHEALLDLRDELMIVIDGYKEALDDAEAEALRAREETRDLHFRVKAFEDVLQPVEV